MKQKRIHTLPIAFDAKHLDEILSQFYPISAKANTTLLAEGAICRELYFIRSGCTRTYFVDEDGFEKTSSIAFDNNFITAWTSFISQSPSLERLETLEDSELLVMSYEETHRLRKSDRQWEDFYQKLLEIALLSQSRKIEALMTLDAKHRYQKLLNGNPQLIQKVSNKILASFLHMREETLSRLKSKR